MLETLLRRIYRREFDTASDIELSAWRAFWQCFNEAVDEGYGVRSYNEDDYDFYRALRTNNGVFAAFRTHRLQNDVAAQLLDENGELKPFERFAYDVRTLIAPTHLDAWLRTEYATAVSRARQAADWKRFEANRDVLPNLRWLPSTSLHPGQDHQVFWNTVRPIDDPFWSAHRPGDRWNCKCSLEATDEPPTENLPEGTASDHPSAGLDNNPARDAKLFSDTHPYIRNAYVGAREAVEQAVATSMDKVRLKLIKEEAKKLRAEPIHHPDFGKPIVLSGRTIDEWTNQPHAHKAVKDELLLDIRNLLAGATYLGYGKDNSDKPGTRYVHLFEVTIEGDHSWIIVKEFQDGKCLLYSISDGKEILKALNEK